MHNDECYHSDDCLACLTGKCTGKQLCVTEFPEPSNSGKLRSERSKMQKGDGRGKGEQFSTNWSEGRIEKSFKKVEHGKRGGLAKPVKGGSAVLG